MKKILMICFLALFQFGCTGWSSEEKEMFMKSCADVGVLDCDCALDIYIKKFSTFDEYVSGGDDKKKAADEAAANCRLWTREEKESFLRKCQETGPSVSVPVDCNCLLKKFTERYPLHDDFIQKITSDTSWVKSASRECGNE